MAKIDEAAIKAAEELCKAKELEEKLRGVVAGITAKLNRSNLSAKEGVRQAEYLVEAYKRLEPFE